MTFFHAVNFMVLKIQDVDLKIQIWLTKLIVYLDELSFELLGIKNGSFFAKIAYVFFYIYKKTKRIAGASSFKGENAL